MRAQLIAPHQLAPTIASERCSCVSRPLTGDFDGAAVDGQDTMQARQLSAVDEVAPPPEVALMRLAGRLAAEPLQVAVGRGLPLPEGLGV